MLQRHTKGSSNGRQHQSRCATAWAAYPVHVFVHVYVCVRVWASVGMYECGKCIGKNSAGCKFVLIVVVCML